MLGSWQGQMQHAAYASAAKCLHLHIQGTCCVTAFASRRLIGTNSDVSSCVQAGLDILFKRQAGRPCKAVGPQPQEMAHQTSDQTGLDELHRDGPSSAARPPHRLAQGTPRHLAGLLPGPVEPLLSCQQTECSQAFQLHLHCISEVDFTPKACCNSQVHSRKGFYLEDTGKLSA